MGHKFSDFMRELEEEARREGPEAVSEAAVFDAQFGLAAELMLLRKRRGLTHRQLSARSGIQQSEISEIEGGRANPTLSTLSAVARALGAELGIRIRPGSRGKRRAQPTGQRRTGAL